MSQREISLLLLSLDTAFDHRSWHGTNLRGSLRRVSPQEAAFRPSAERHNIWELALHCAYWKYAVHRRISGGKRGGFPLAGSNFFRRPLGRPSSEDWKADLQLLARAHRELRGTVETLPARRLEETGKGQTTLRQMILGVAAHDFYHAGQIQLLKRLCRAA